MNLLDKLRQGVKANELDENVDDIPEPLETQSREEREVIALPKEQDSLEGNRPEEVDVVEVPEGVPPAQCEPLRTHADSESVETNKQITLALLKETRGLQLDLKQRIARLIASTQELRQEVKHLKEQLMAQGKPILKAGGLSRYQMLLIIILSSTLTTTLTIGVLILFATLLSVG